MTAQEDHSRYKEHSEKGYKDKNKDDNIKSGVPSAYNVQCNAIGHG